MIRIAALLGLVAAPAIGQGIIAPPTGLDTVTCGEFATMDSLGRLAALRGVQPLGDVIGEGNSQPTRDWVADVAAECRGTPDRSLADAAGAVLSLPPT